MKNITIDGVTINAKHFAAMPEAKAVKCMLADGLVPDSAGTTITEKEVWAKRAYNLIVPPKKSEKPI